jgi:hypothetical protein
MSVSTQEVKDQIAEMRSAIDAADEARRRTGKTKLVGTAMAFCIVVMFVWAFFSLGRGIVTNPESIQRPLMAELEASNFTQSLAQLPAALAEGAMPHVNEFIDNVWEDEQNKATIQGFLDDHLMPSIQAKFENDVLPELSAAAKDQLSGMGEELEADLKKVLKDSIGGIAVKQKAALSAALTPAQVDEILLTITEAAEAAAEMAVADQFKSHTESLERIADAQSEICKYEVQDADDIGLRLVILRLLGYGLLAPETTEEDE